jgi:hypothetical protein
MMADKMEIFSWAFRIYEITSQSVDAMGFNERRMAFAEIRKEAQKIMNAMRKPRKGENQ